MAKDEDKLLTPEVTPSSIAVDANDNNVTTRSKRVVWDVAMRCLPNVVMDNGVRVLKILDYGSGNGRYLQAILPIATALKRNSNIKVELIAYDPNSQELKKFEKNLQEIAFKKVESQCHGYRDIECQPGGTQSYLANTYENEEINLRVKLIHGHVFDDLNHIKNLIGSAHMGMCMLGAVSHIPMKENRIKLLSMLSDVIMVRLILTLPSYMIFQKEKALIDMARSTFVELLIDDLKEPGNILYPADKEAGLEVSGSKTAVKTIMHLYKSPEEIMLELRAAKLEGKVRVQNILLEETLTKSWTLSKADEYASALMPSTLAPYLATYYLVTASTAKKLVKPEVIPEATPKPKL
ncbi:MAG: hypothetical protein WC756_21500 [Taibaiella sp.]|jgi:hypothetical protein